ncbi:MAG: hypothetical protein NTX08_02365 [Sphingobacteriales bacterium]|nr:hypothetical protein [Sphingobacteriales bacterium]
MKLKYGIIILALGICMDFAGAWMKLTHQANADQVFLFSTVLKIVAMLFIVIKLVTHPKLRDFMNY